jgi:DNA-binding PadR family transcriptional regulator
MSNSPMKFDVSEMIDGIRGMVSSAMNGANRMGSASPSAADLRIAVMSALKGDSKNGKEVIEAISIASGGTWTPKKSSIYPLLEELTDEELVAIKIEKELRVYSLTKKGKAYLAEELAKKQETKDKPASSKNNWVEINSAGVKASVKLAQALAQVAQTGTPDQQKRATELVDETRRKVHAILAED